MTWNQLKKGVTMSWSSLHFLARMSRSGLWRFAAIGLLIIASTANASGSDAAVSSTADADALEVQDLLFCAAQRPFLIRLHLQVNGRGFRAMRQQWVDAQFAILDTDKNGILELDELKGLPSPETLRPDLTLETAKFLKADFDPADGKVSLAEYRWYMMNGLATPFSIVQQTAGVQINLFPKLDTNLDGKLSAEEIAAGDTKLRRYDQNEDDVVTATELQQGRAEGQGNATQEIAGVLGLLVIVDMSDRGLAVSRRLLEAYDKTSRDPVAKMFRKDDRLSKTELLVEPEVFERADRNHDGKLDRTELGLISSLMTPSIELVIEAPSVSGEFTVNSLRSSDPKAANAIDVHREATGRWLLVFNDTAFSLNAAGTPANVEQQLRNTYVSRFKNLDQDQNDYLESTELQRFGFPESFFTQADTDHDGKLFEKEYVAYIDREIEFSKSSFALEVAGDGRSLFSLIDVNPADDRLTLRELADAPVRLKEWDANGDGAITLTELSIALNAVFRAGTPRINGPFGLRQVNTMENNVARNDSSSLPSWFVKMDRNGDGDLSPKEFLGRRTLFNGIDKNHDGLISADEAKSIVTGQD